ncbi:MAG: hypothetical protein GY711_15150 [bacterium]|nr:hypothetical protein [bacterium]
MTRPLGLDLMPGGAEHVTLHLQALAVGPGGRATLTGPSVLTIVDGAF